MSLTPEPRVIPFGDHLDMIDQRNRLMERASKAEAERDALLAERETLQKALREGDSALKAWIATAITLRAHLGEPYPDDTRWTPYTRFVERELRRTEVARATIRAALAGGAPE